MQSINLLHGMMHGSTLAACERTFIEEIRICSTPSESFLHLGIVHVSIACYSGSRSLGSHQRLGMVRVSSIAKIAMHVCGPSLLSIPRSPLVMPGRLGRLGRLGIFATD